MKKKTPFISKLYVALIFVFLYAPIAVMMLFSLNSTSSTYIFSGFSTHPDPYPGKPVPLRDR